jgi:Family of unknown function (DUF6477)
MPDLRSAISALRRPRLLVRAARAGMRAYQREAHLAPLAPHADPCRDPVAVIETLREMEENCEGARRARSEQYSPAWHVSVLTALLGEMALLPAGA